MNQKQWKANYRAARMIHSGLIKMLCINNDNSDLAVGEVWETIKRLDMVDVMFGSKKKITYDILTHKWAIKTNHRGIV